MPEINSFLRKAISLFVVLEEERKTQPINIPAQKTPATNGASAPAAHVPEADISKFEKHFSELFEKANFPGPDYFEFWKMMDSLEGPIPDERVRVKAVFDALRIQGMTKGVLLQTAEQYRNLVIEDKNNFEAAVRERVQSEVQSRAATIRELEKSKTEKEQAIVRLQEEIAAAMQQMQALQQEIVAAQSKIESAQSGYITACSAMISKIERDIKDFQALIP
jgi:hypothetical protein